MAAMTFDDICTRLIAYFAQHFHDPPENFTKGTNVKVTYNCDDGEWGAFADKINALDWMVKLNILISQKEMRTRPTIGQLGKLIFDQQKAPKKGAKKPAVKMAGAAANGKAAGSKSPAKAATKAKKASKPPAKSGKK